MASLRDKLERLGWRLWIRLHDQRGLTTVEYIIGAGIILVVLSGAVLAWNNGLAAKINQLVQQLMGTP
jgi:Flp pilus assembly pilin Flp